MGESGDHLNLADALSLAARLLEAAAGQRGRTGAAPQVDERRSLAAAWAEGQALDVQPAVELALVALAAPPPEPAAVP
jgi:hypothetical protein